MPEVKVGLFAPLHAKPDQVSALSDFLVAGHGLLSAEPLTQAWYAMKYTSNALDTSKDSALEGTYAVFDTFVDEEGRTKHAEGEIAGAMVKHAPNLLASVPERSTVNILASKVEKADCKFGLRVLMQAKPGKAEDVEKFLIGACQKVIETEPLTFQWYALRFTDAAGNPTNQFGIIDFSETEEGRKAHFTGEVANALFAKADEFFEKPGPEIIKVDVVASRVL